MCARLWMLVAVLSTAVVAGRPTDEENRTGRVQESAFKPYTPTTQNRMLDVAIQDAIVTELNNGREIVLPSTFDSNSFGSDEEADRSIDELSESKTPVPIPVTSRTTTENSIQTTEKPPKDVQLGRNLRLNNLGELLNTKYPVIEYISTNNQLVDNPMHDVNPSVAEDRIASLQKVNHGQYAVTPTQTFQEGPFTLYFRPQYQYASPYSRGNYLLRSPAQIHNSDIEGRLNWFSSYFPIIIHNPVPYLIDSMSQIIEYGPESDVCSSNKQVNTVEDNSLKTSRSGRAMVLLSDDGKGDLTMKGDTNVEIIRENTENLQNSGVKDTIMKENNNDGKDEQTELVMETGGSQTEGRGPFITRLLVRKGGVAIAGPGGIATAGSGGTTIVGPGGIAYTKPNALSVVGPGGKVISLPEGQSEPRSGELPPGARIVALLLLETTSLSTYSPAPCPRSSGWTYYTPALLPAVGGQYRLQHPSTAYTNLYTIINGRLIQQANLYPSPTGHNFYRSPIIVPQLQTGINSIKTVQRQSSIEGIRENPDQSSKIIFPNFVADVQKSALKENNPKSTKKVDVPKYPWNHPPILYTEEEKIEEDKKEEPTIASTTLILKPQAKAIAGRNGTAIATPVSHAIYRKGQPVNIHFDPKAVAIAGPGGTAKAHSDLIVSYVDTNEQSHSS